MKQENHNIYFSTRDELTKVCLDDLMYVASEGNYITLKFKSGRTQMLLASLSNFEQVTQSVSDIRFVRIGRSHIVNLAYVSQVNTLRKSIIMVDDELKMTIELVASKEAIRQLRQIIYESKKTEIPHFKTTNGTMEAFQVVGS